MVLLFWSPFEGLTSRLVYVLVTIVTITVLLLQITSQIKFLCSVSRWFKSVRLNTGRE